MEKSHDDQRTIATTSCFFSEDLENVHIFLFRMEGGVLEKFS